MPYPKITHVTLEPIYPHDHRKDYHFDSIDDFPLMFDYIKTNLRLSSGFHNVVFEDMADRVYSVFVQGRLRFIARFHETVLVTLR